MGFVEFDACVCNLHMGMWSCLAFGLGSTIPMYILWRTVPLWKYTAHSAFLADAANT